MLSSRAPPRDPARGNAPGPASNVRARDFVIPIPTPVVPFRPRGRTPPLRPVPSNGIRSPSVADWPGSLTLCVIESRQPAPPLPHSRFAAASLRRSRHPFRCSASEDSHPSLLNKCEARDPRECVFAVRSAGPTRRRGGPAEPCRTVTQDQRDGRETCLTATCSGVQLNADTPSGTHMAPARPHGPNIPHPMLNTRQH
jgi:hypothetical protein